MASKYIRPETIDRLCVLERLDKILTSEDEEDLRALERLVEIEKDANRGEEAFSLPDVRS